MVDEYGEPEFDLDAAIADATLREALADLPEPDATVGDEPGRVAAVESLITAAWPDGTPPTAAELADDPGFADFIAAVGPGDDSSPDVAAGPDHDSPADTHHDSPADAHAHDSGDAFGDWSHETGFGDDDFPDSSDGV